MPHRRLLFALALIGVLQEVGVRAVFPLPEIVDFDRLRYSPLAQAAPDELPTSLGHASFSWASDPDGFEFVHRLNLYGFRDGEWRLRAAPGRTRVAFVGDSFVEGLSADVESAIPAVFRRVAGERGRSVETLNLGIAGAGLEVYARLVRDAVPLFRPDSVVLVLYANDLVPIRFDPGWLDAPLDPERRSPWQPRILPVLRQLRSGGRVPRRWIAPPFSYIAAVPDPRNPWSQERSARRLAAFVTPSIAEAMRRGRFNPALASWFPWAPNALGRTVDLTPHVSALAAWTKRFGSELLVVYLPLKNQASDRYLAFQADYSPPGSVRSLLGEEFQRHAALLAATCRGLGVPFLDLTPVLRKGESAGPSLYWSYDDHLRPRGYRVAGERIFSWWVDAVARP